MGQQNEADNPGLSQVDQALFDEHQSIIRMGVLKRRFQTMPLGGDSAIQAGLVTRSDPSWLMSDAYGAYDSFRLTDLGTKIALAQGWRCRCAGCNEWRGRKGWSPAVAAGRFCSNCEAGIAQYGTVQLNGQESCKLDAQLILEADQQGRERK